MINYLREGPIPVNRIPNSYWCSHGNFSLYCRRSFRYICGERMRSFTIANIQCPERCRGKGEFKELLHLIEREAIQAGYDVVSFESVLNHRFASFLEKRGYVSDHTSSLSSYDKVLLAQANETCYNGDAIVLL